MNCPHCVKRPILKGGVTCGGSECQEREFHANQERNKPKRRRLKPKAGAKKADGTLYEETEHSMARAKEMMANGILPARFEGTPPAGPEWTEVPGGLMKMEIPVPTPTSNEHMFARLLVEVTGHVKFDYVMMTSLAHGMGIKWDEITHILDRAEAVVNRVKNHKR